MALTNESAQNLTTNVVTDVNADVSAGPREGLKISREAALLFNKAIIARPLLTPEVASIHVKNTEYAYRWVNRLSQDGRFYNQRRAQGFVNATLDDVDILSGDTTGSMTEITAGDVILMKIRADIYDAALKWNMEKAWILSRTRGMYLQGGSTDVNSDAQPKRMSVANEPFSRSGKAQAFIPDNPDALVDDSIKSGRVEQTRRVVDDLRKEGQAAKTAASAKKDS